MPGVSDIADVDFVVLSVAMVAVHAVRRRRVAQHRAESIGRLHRLLDRVTPVAEWELNDESWGGGRFWHLQGLAQRWDALPISNERALLLIEAGVPLEQATDAAVAALSDTDLQALAVLAATPKPGRRP